MATYPFQVMLDRRFERTGSYNAPLQRTSFFLPLDDTSIDVAVLSDDFGDDAGTVLPIVSNSGGVAKVAGDYSGGTVMLGRSFYLGCELTRPYVRDSQGRAVTDGDMQYVSEAIVPSHHRSFAYLVRGRIPGTVDRDVTLDSDTAVDGQLATWLNGPVDTTQVFIISLKPKPCTITQVRYVCDYTRRIY